MLKAGAIAVLVSGVFLAAASGPEAPPTVQAGMVQVIAPQTQAIWDVTNRATDDSGEPDPSKISPADWIALQKAGEQLSAQSRLLAEAQTVVVAGPGVKIQDEGGPGGSSAKHVQGYIDANRAAFAEHARKLADAGDAVAKAAGAKDAAPLFQAANDLDQICESCHVQFWYPQQVTSPQ